MSGGCVNRKTQLTLLSKQVAKQKGNKAGGRAQQDRGSSGGLSVFPPMCYKHIYSYVGMSTRVHMVLRFFSLTLVTQPSGLHARTRGRNSRGRQTLSARPGQPGPSGNMPDRATTLKAPLALRGAIPFLQHDVIISGHRLPLMSRYSPDDFRRVSQH